MDWWKSRVEEKHRWDETRQGGRGTSGRDCIEEVGDECGDGGQKSL
jgi:hypothetical protein